MSNYDWDAHNRRTVIEGRQILERTSASLARSSQVRETLKKTSSFRLIWLISSSQVDPFIVLLKVAIETENTGTEILSELDSQRESLLRASDRLDTANDGLFESNRILKMMKRNVLYNKLILILIIVIEVFILASMIYLKFIH